MSGCLRSPELWADTCERGGGFIFSAAAVLTEWGLSFAHTMQVRLDRIDTGIYQKYTCFAAIVLSLLFNPNLNVPNKGRA